MPRGGDSESELLGPSFNFLGSVLSSRAPAVKSGSHRREVEGVQGRGRDRGKNGERDRDPVKKERRIVQSSKGSLMYEEEFFNNFL